MKISEIAPPEVGKGAARIILTGPAVEVYRGTASADRFELASVTAADSPYSKEKDSQS